MLGIGFVLLGLGDAFHLIPRAIGLYTATLDNPNQSLSFWLGSGKLITSITMTIFYVLLYIFIYQRNNEKKLLILDVSIFALFIARITLLAFPQNDWLNNSGDLLWGIIRNIPFVIMGGIVVVLCFKYFKFDKYLKWLSYIIILSFLFYLAVVIWAGEYNWVGMLMLPKTLCYMFIGLLILFDSRKENKNEIK